MSCHNKSAEMTPLGVAEHERCKTGECSATASTVCITTVAAVVAVLVLSGRLRLMEQILSRPHVEACVCKEKREREEVGGRSCERREARGVEDKVIEGE